MISHVSQIRVRYRDTDQMGVVYHGVYLEYFETGRTELLRELGIPYSGIEEKGLMLPVLDFALKIERPARYDDLLHVESVIDRMEGARLRIDYHLYRVGDPELLVIGHTTHAFVSVGDLSPRRPPRFFLDRLEQATVG
jgi:acyl-CoA thioester hydrolase